MTKKIFLSVLLLAFAVQGFAQSLSLLDEVILLDIYPARELPMEGITSNIILDKITTKNKKLLSKDELLSYISNNNFEVALPRRYPSTMIQIIGVDKFNKTVTLNKEFK